MAVKKTATYREIMSDLQAGKFMPVYILMGEEAYYIDKISDYIAENALKPEERDFNQSVVFGTDVTSGQIVDLARQFPMLADRQVVIVKEAQNIKNWERLEIYVEKPVQTTVLVICYKNGTIDRRKKIITNAASKGVVFDSKKKWDNELPVFIKEYVNAKGATIDDKSVSLLSDHIGNDLSRMSSEIDKLLLCLSEDARSITSDLVAEKIGVSKDFNGFELRSAIINKDIYKANRIVEYFKGNPKAESVYILIPTLFSYFQNLLIAYYAPQPKTSRDIANWLGMKSEWGVGDYITGMRKYSANKVVDIITKLRETDAKSKGLDNPNTLIGDLLTELIFFIMH
ncbi:MAG: DNA polymerase III subunit delta [Prevotella sp.]|nr:DNA polymerase III subunit delta [Prevotella sp.]